MDWFVAAAVLPSFLIALAAGFVVRRVAPRIGLVNAPGGRSARARRAARRRTGNLAGRGRRVCPGASHACFLDARCRCAGHERRGEQFRRRNRAFGGRPGSVALPRRHACRRIATAGRRSLGVLAAASAAMLLGLVDDFRGLDWRLRLAVQTALAALLVFGKGWQLTLFLDAPLATGLLSVVWIVGLVNSFNMLDNMDGLSAGVATIAAVMLAGVLLLAPNPITHGPQLFVAGFLLVLAGALAGFLWHNRPPARLFMGDAGSYFVGFCLGVATLLATFSGGSLPRHAILAPLCVLAVPLYDTVSVVCIRLRAGAARSPPITVTSRIVSSIWVSAKGKPC